MTLIRTGIKLGYEFENITATLVEGQIIPDTTNWMNVKFPKTNEMSSLVKMLFIYLACPISGVLLPCRSCYINVA